MTDSPAAVLPSLEIHIPISPTPKFFRMVRCLVASLRHFGGLYSDAKVVLTIGDPVIRDREVHAENPWLSEWGIETRWVPEELYAKDIYYATANQRFSYEYASAMVLMMDADMLVARPFDDLVVRLHREQRFGGMITHISPFDDFSMWQKVYDACGLGEVRAIHEHTGWPYLIKDPSLRFCPPYFNLGFLLMPAGHATKIGEQIYPLMYKIADTFETHYKCQLAVGLAVVQQAIPYECLSMRYNFANDPQLEALYPVEQVEATIIHILRKHQEVSKDTLYEQPVGLDDFLSRIDLAGINKLAQSVVRKVAGHHC